MTQEVPPPGEAPQGAKQHSSTLAQAPYREVTVAAVSLGRKATAAAQPPMIAALTP